MCVCLFQVCQCICVQVCMHVCVGLYLLLFLSLYLLRHNLQAWSSPIPSSQLGPGFCCLCLLSDETAQFQLGFWGSGLLDLTLATASNLSTEHLPVPPEVIVNESFELPRAQAADPNHAPWTGHLGNGAPVSTGAFLCSCKQGSGWGSVWQKMAEWAGAS